MAKCFLRPHEAVKLSVTPPYYDPDNGVLRIPEDERYGRKRVGNHTLVIDAELRRLMARYLAWRDEHVQRRPDGTPVTDKLILNNNGTAHSPEAFLTNLEDQLARDCRRLGIPQRVKDGLLKPFTPHSFRGFATTWAADHGAPDSAFRVLRGDEAAGALDRYDQYIQRLPELYRRYGPRLGL